MTVKVSDLVISTAGHDKGGLFLVLEEDGDHVYLADGKSRKIEKPKRKRLKHLQYAGAAESRMAEKLSGGEKPGNSELRRVIADFRKEHYGE